MPVFNFTTIDVPLADNTEVAGINGAGQIVGSYLVGSTTQGFLLSGGAFTKIDDPLGSNTFAQGINGAGQIVGDYPTANGIHGFVYNPNGGIYTTFDDPAANNATTPRGINDSGMIVGDYGDDTGTHGFLYNPNSATPFTNFDDPFECHYRVRVTAKCRDDRVTASHYKRKIDH
jgi:hypothetical protein